MDTVPEGDPSQSPRLTAAATTPAGLSAPEHEIGLFTIAGQTRQRVGFTTDREALAAQVSGLFVERYAGALLVDGLLETWDRRFDEEDAWPVFVLVVHDGPETSSWQDRQFNEFILDLMTRGATAHSILVSTSTRGGELQTAVSTSLAENTGGFYTSLAAPTALTRALTELARTMAAHYDEAKNRYRVVFEPIRTTRRRRSTCG